jgi:hypothetical protein
MLNRLNGLPSCMKVECFKLKHKFVLKTAPETQATAQHFFVAKARTDPPISKNKRNSIRQH